MCANFGFGALVGGPLPIIDEAHGERLAGHAVSKRLREGQGGAALERLHHGRAIRRALRVLCVARLKCDPRLPNSSPLRLKLISTAFEHLGVETIGLGSPMLARHRHTRGVNDVGLDAARLEPACQPEAVTAGLEGNDNAFDPASCFLRFLPPAMQQL